MIYTGKKEDLNNMKENSSKFRKIVASMLLAGSIIGISGMNAHAAGMYTNQHLAEAKIAGHSAEIEKEIQKMYERDDLIDQYKMMGYSQESAERQADYEMHKKDFAKGLKVTTNKNNEKIVSIPNNSKVKNKVQDDDRSRW